MQEIETMVSLDYARLWIFLTAVIFTGMGFFWGASVKTDRAAAAVIDMLVREGYLRTRGEGKEAKILKYWEEDKDE